MVPLRLRICPTLLDVTNMIHLSTFSFPLATVFVSFTWAKS